MLKKPIITTILNISLSNVSCGQDCKETDESEARLHVSNRKIILLSSGSEAHVAGCPEWS